MMCKNLYGKTGTVLLLPWLIWSSSSGMNNDKKIKLKLNEAPGGKIVHLLHEILSTCNPQKDEIFDLRDLQRNISNNYLIDIKESLKIINFSKNNSAKDIDSLKHYRKKRLPDFARFNGWFGIAFFLRLLPYPQFLPHSFILEVPTYLINFEKNELERECTRVFRIWNNLKDIENILKRQIHPPLVGNLANLRGKNTSCDLGIKFTNPVGIKAELKKIRIKKLKITDHSPYSVQKKLTPRLVKSTNKLILNTALKLPGLFTKGKTEKKIKSV